MGECDLSDRSGVRGLGEAARREADGSQPTAIGQQFARCPRRRWRLARLHRGGKGSRMKRVLWVLGALAVSAVAMRVPAAQIVLPGQPHAAFGDSVTPAYEGWFDSPDGRHNIMFGYYNRNSKQEFDIPIGADNNIQPGGPDRGQPTHFLTGRQWGVFLINVPKDFPATTNIIWSLTANGQQIAIPVHMKPDYNIDPFEEAAVHNTPPTIRFDEHGETVQGPLATTFDRTA